MSEVGVRITDLSDDILLYIFTFLGSWDKLNMIETTERLSKIAKDHSLWRSANFEVKPLTSVQIKRRVIPCLHSGTKVLHFRGRRKRSNRVKNFKSDLVTPSLMEAIGKKCPFLQDLTIKEAVVDARKFKLVNYGKIKDLKSLSLVACELVNLPSPVSDGSYFRNMHVVLPALRHLEITHCKWINDYDLMVLSKLDSLKRLVLKGDLRVGCTIAYLSISFRFGFRNLEELDLRGTSLQNSDVQSVVQSGKLRTLSIGPIGRIRRLSEIYPDLDDGFNLVMPDPRRKDEPKQQVVVINLGPNGPGWRQASDEDLDEMGLQWVKNGLRSVSQSSGAENDCDDETHYFFGKEGKLVSSAPSGSRAENNLDSQNDKKRCLEDDDLDYSDDDIASSSKRRRLSSSLQEESSSDDEEAPFCERGGAVDIDPPDEALSDAMVHCFKNRAKNLQNLVIAGCAITDHGLMELVRCAPSLKFLDVTNTHVTSEGTRKAQTVLPECVVVMKPRISKSDEMNFL